MNGGFLRMYYGKCRGKYTRTLVDLYGKLEQIGTCLYHFLWILWLSLLGLGCFRIPPTHQLRCNRGFIQSEGQDCGFSTQNLSGGGTTCWWLRNPAINNAVDIWVFISPWILWRVSLHVRLTLGFLNQQEGLWGCLILCHYLLHVRLTLGFLVAIQQFLTSEVSKIPGLDFGEIVWGWTSRICRMGRMGKHFITTMGLFGYSRRVGYL